MKNYLFTNNDDIEQDFDAEDFNDAVEELRFHFEIHDNWRVVKLSEDTSKVHIFLSGYDMGYLYCTEREKETNV